MDLIYDDYDVHESWSDSEWATVWDVTWRTLPYLKVVRQMNLAMGGDVKLDFRKKGDHRRDENKRKMMVTIA